MGGNCTEAPGQQYASVKNDGGRKMTTDLTRNMEDIVIVAREKEV